MEAEVESLGEAQRRVLMRLPWQCLTVCGTSFGGSVLFFLTVFNFAPKTCSDVGIIKHCTFPGILICTVCSVVSVSIVGDREYDPKVEVTR